MSLLEIFRTAFESLTTNKLRTLLTMLGIVIGVAAVVILLAMGEGVQLYIDKQFAGFGSNLITITPNLKVPDARLTMDDSRAIADKANVPNVKRVVPSVGGELKISANGNSISRNINGVTPDNFSMRNIGLIQGSSFTNSDVENRNRVAVLGYKVAQDLFPDQVALGQNILIDSLPARVVGVTEKKGSQGPSTSTDDMIFVPITVAQEKLLANRPGGVKSVSSITVEAESAATSSRAVNDIAKTLRGRHNLLAGQTDDFQVLDQASLLSSLSSIINILQIFLALIGAIALLVGGIGIMNIMIVNVTERTREIGVRKAIGADPATIRLQFLIEAIVVTCLAGVLGIVLSWLCVVITNSVQTTFTPVIQLDAVILAFGVSVFIGVVFGLYPAIRASNMEPVEALRYE
ncbi:MAG: ABC transporter permease [Anaerolineae bacterium]|nr:ABC transporter permease [Anaerolineae bacterium]